MFMEVIDQNNVTTVINTESIVDVRIRKSEDVEPIFMSAYVKMYNGDVILLDETNWDALRQILLH